MGIGDEAKECKSQGERIDPKRNRERVALGVGVESCEIEIDSKIGHENRAKAPEGEEGEEIVVMFGSKQAKVQDKRIEKNRDVRPCLFGVPRPVSSPALISPNTSEEVPYHQKGESENEGDLIDLGELMDGLI